MELVIFKGVFLGRLIMVHVLNATYQKKIQSTWIEHKIEYEKREDVMGVMKIIKIQYKKFSKK